MQKNNQKQLQNLVLELKTKNSAVYEWLVARGINFHNLGKQTSQFMTAAGFLLSLPKGSILPPPDIDITPSVEHTIKAPTKSKSDTERGQEVWAKYGQFIRESAAKYGVDPNLIFATIMIESGGNPQAIRHEPRLGDASYGLGQLLYGTARGLGYKGTPEGLYDPATNIDLIAKYHRRTLDKYGHLTAQQLTTAYNAGSPYSKALAGHINKFNKWYNRVENLEVDLT